MIALFGIGPLELVILLVFGLVFVGAPIVTLVVIVSVARQRRPAELEADVERVPDTGSPPCDLPDN